MPGLLKNLLFFFSPANNCTCSFDPAQGLPRRIRSGDLHGGIWLANSRTDGIGPGVLGLRCYSHAGFSKASLRMSGDYICCAPAC